MKTVTIPNPDTTVTLGEGGAVVWQGRKIGRVWKGHRTYSPPLHKGSRVAKYHKQVPCWYAAPMDGRPLGLTFDTRRAAIRFLLDDASE